MKSENQLMSSRRKVLGAVGATAGLIGVREVSAENSQEGGQERGNWLMEGLNSGGTNHAPSASAPTSEKITRAWSVELSESPLHAPIVVNKRAFVPSDGPKPRVHAVNVQSGEHAWKRKLNGVTKTSAVSDRGGPVIGVSTTRENESPGVRSFDNDGRPGSKRVFNKFGYNTAKRYDGRIYLGTEGGEVLSVETGSLAESWQRTDFLTHARVMSLVATSGKVVVGTLNQPYNNGEDGGRGGKTGTVTAFDSGSGSDVWRREFTTPIVTVAAAGGAVIASSERQLTLLDIETGDTLWSVEQTGAGGGIALTENRVVTGGNGEIRAHSLRNGEKIWDTDFGSGTPSPVVADGRVYVSAGGIPAEKIALDDGTTRPAPNGRLVVLDYEDGTTRQQYEFDTDRISQPVIAQNTVFVTDHSGNIHAFE
jgi:hypothetical protein